jgi:type I restriction enzyme S subunit
MAAKPISEIANRVSSGLTPLRSNPDFWQNGTIPWLKTEQLGEKHIYSTTEKISALALRETSIKVCPENTLSIAMYGEGKTRGNVSIIKAEMATNQACCNVELDPELADYEYVYYFLKTQYEALRNLSSGVRKNLNSNDIKNFVVRLPAKVSEQRRIAAVLSALDCKIDCNNRINAELEAIAKTLYDYWFVQFDFPDANGKPYKSSGGKMVYNATLKREIPAGWCDSSVLAVADLLGGGTPTKKKPEYWSGDIPFFTPTDADGTIFKFSTADYITDEGLKGSSTKLFGKHTVFITARGSVGRLVLAGVDMAMNQSCYALRAKAKISHVFLFFLAKELIHHLQVKSSGSVFDSIVSNDIELTNLAIPKGGVIEKFASVVEPAFEKIANNTKENQQLAQLRDWLLPLLMNGQATVA